MGVLVGRGCLVVWVGGCLVIVAGPVVSSRVRVWGDGLAAVLACYAGRRASIDARCLAHRVVN